MLCEAWLAFPKLCRHPMRSSVAFPIASTCNIILRAAVFVCTNNNNYYYYYYYYYYCSKRFSEYTLMRVFAKRVLALPSGKYS